MRAVRGMGRGLPDHHLVLCKVRLVDAWIKRREVVTVIGARRIRSEKLREHKYIEGYEGRWMNEEIEDLKWFCGIWF